MENLQQEGGSRGPSSSFKPQEPRPAEDWCIGENEATVPRARLVHALTKIK